MSVYDKNMLIERYGRGREDALVNLYIQDGPTQLQENLDLTDEEWRVLFDYLVFEHNLLYKAVTHSLDFFLEAYIKHGGVHVRGILDVEEENYDEIWRVCFDFMAISHEGLYYHVLENRERYIIGFKARGGDFVRSVLGIWHPKYEENWLKILDLLLHGVCDGIFSERTFEQGTMAFAYLINGSREHRVIEKSEIVGGGLL